MKPSIVQEQKEIKSAMKKHGPENSQHKILFPPGRVKFCKSNVVTHQHGKGCMRRYR